MISQVVSSGWASVVMFTCKMWSQSDGSMGAMVGSLEGAKELVGADEIEGDEDGALEGVAVGFCVGDAVGALVGGFVGDAVGGLVGGFDGLPVGGNVGMMGALVGVAVGGFVGGFVGGLVGGFVGFNIGVTSSTGSSPSNVTRKVNIPDPSGVSLKLSITVPVTLISPFT